MILIFMILTILFGLAAFALSNSSIPELRIIGIPSGVMALFFGYALITTTYRISKATKEINDILKDRGDPTLPKDEDCNND